MTIRFLLFFLALATSGFSKSSELMKDSVFVEKLKCAIDSVYNLKFNAARTILYSHPGFNDNPLSSLWVAYEKWWSILIDLENTSLDEEFFITLERSQNHAEQWLEDDPTHLDALMAAALTHAFTGRQHANRGDWFGSIKNARHAYHHLKTIEEIVPEHPDLLFSKGMINFYLEIVPAKYPLIKMITWALPPGNRELGLAQIDSAAQVGIFLRNEARYFCGTIRLNYEDKPREAQEYIHGLLNSFPENGYYYDLLCRIWQRTSDYARADSLAKVGLEKFSGTSHMELSTTETLSFLRASYSYKKKKFDEAEKYAQLTITKSQKLPEFPRRKYYTRSAYLLGQISEKGGAIDLAKHWYREAARSGGDPGVEKLARKARRSL